MPKSDVVLIFGESANDRAAIRELALALEPTIKNAQVRRQPLVLIKNRKPKEAEQAAVKIANVVKADQVRYNVQAVIAHEDCDAVEPAHIAVSNDIENKLRAAGVKNPIAAAPAYEIEAWWYLWPDAVSAVCTKWRKLGRNGQSVGTIIDAKKQLQRDLRPIGKAEKAPEYEESHSISIARKIRERNEISQRSASSDSFDLFATRLRSVIK